MKLPVTPPPWIPLFQQHAERLGSLLDMRLGAEVNGQYEH